MAQHQASNTPKAANENDAHVYVGKHEAAGKHGSMSSRGGPAKIRVFCDLPDKLALLPEEIAIVAPFLTDIVTGIIANDDIEEPS